MHYKSVTRTEFGSAKVSTSRQAHVLTRAAAERLTTLRPAPARPAGRAAAAKHQHRRSKFAQTIQQKFYPSSTRPSTILHYKRIKLQSPFSCWLKFSRVHKSKHSCPKACLPACFMLTCVDICVLNLLPSRSTEYLSVSHYPIQNWLQGLAWSRPWLPGTCRVRGEGELLCFPVKLHVRSVVRALQMILRVCVCVPRTMHRVIN